MWLSTSFSFSVFQEIMVLIHFNEQIHDSEWKCSLLSCAWLCDSMDCSLPGSSVHGVFQARILQWLAVPFSRGSSWPRDQIRVSCIAGRFLLEDPEPPGKQSSGRENMLWAPWQWKAFLETTISGVSWFSD